MEAFLIFVGLIFIACMMRAAWHMKQAENTMRRISERYRSGKP